ncbi:hypothetical protein KBD08_03820 [Candidatus Babeliales bacterium]|nr:hypothetical protein [Candidatus Babeliales bacterium]
MQCKLFKQLYFCALFSLVLSDVAYGIILTGSVRSSSCTNSFNSDDSSSRDSYSSRNSCSGFVKIDENSCSSATMTESHSKSHVSSRQETVMTESPVSSRQETVKIESRVDSKVEEEEERRRNDDYYERQNELRRKQILDDEERSQYWEEQALKKRKIEQEVQKTKKAQQNNRLKNLNDQINAYGKDPKILQRAHLAVPLDQDARRAKILSDQLVVPDSFTKKIVFTDYDVGVENKLILALLSKKETPLSGGLLQTKKIMQARQDLVHNQFKNDVTLTPLTSVKINKLQEDTITVFIPTQEYYQKNKKMFSVPLKCNGYHVFIPEILKLDKQSDKHQLISKSSGLGNAPTFDVSYIGGNGGGGPFKPQDPDDSKDDGQKSSVKSFFKSVGVAILGSCVGQLAMTAEIAGIGVTVSIGAGVPVVVGSMVIGYLVKVRSHKRNIVTPTDLVSKAQNVSKDQHGDYQQKTKKFQDLLEQEKIIFLSEQANKQAFQNGVYVASSQENLVIDGPVVDPNLAYNHGHGQRLLDLSTAVEGSNDRYIVHEGNVIKFTCTSGGGWFDKTKKYSAKVVQDLNVLTRADKQHLFACYGYDANQVLYLQKKKREREELARKTREDDSNRSNNSDPDQGPKKNPPGKGVVAAVAANETKKKVMKYTGNPKHHINAKGPASKPPRDGQKVLDNSVLVKTNKNGLSDRVGVEDGQIIKLHEHAPSEYHGYIEENPKSMPSAYKDALYEAGLIKSTKSCKVIK